MTRKTTNRRFDLKLTGIPIPISVKLLIPIMLANLLIAGVVLYGAVRWNQHQLRHRLQNEARTIAHAINYAAENIADRNDLQRLVAAVGAEEGVNILAVVSLPELEVLASNRYSWINAELDSLEIDASVREFVVNSSHKSEQIWIDSGCSRVYCIEPIRWVQPSGPLRYGIVVLTMDAHRANIEIASDTWYVVGNLILVLLLMTLLYGLLLKWVILNPIERLAKASPTSPDSLQHYKSPYVAHDELGQLSRSLEDAYSSLSAKVEDLRSSAEQLRSTGRLAKAGSWRLDLATSQLQMCEQTREILGISAYERATLNDELRRFSAEQQTHIRRAISEAVENRAPFERELQIATPQRQSVSIRLAANPIVVDGQVVALEGAVQDITTYTELRNAALESEQRQRLIADCASLGTWDWDISAGTVAYNPRWMQMLGYGQEELPQTAETWSRLMHPDDLKLALRRLQEHFANPQIPYELEHRMLHKDGTWVWVFSGGRVYLRDENQKAIRMAGIHLDITERRSMDARAIQYQKQNELIVDTVLNSVITLDQSYLVTGWNRQAALTLGYSAEETLGKSFWSLVFDLDLDDVAEIDGICGKLHESVAINKARERVPVEYSMTSLTVDDQSCFVVVLSDISSRRAQIHHQKLESIGLLATGIAHEINTPLQFISDNTSYLEQATQKLLSQINALNEQLESHRLQSIDQLRSWWTHEMAKNKFHKLENNIPEAICDSQEGIQRVIQIIRAMKDFSHPGTDARSELDVNRAIVSTVTLCRNRTKYVADVQLDLQPDLPFIECHPTEISQVILNLIVNATDAVAERLGPRSRGRIDIKSRSRDGGVEISISDNGIGMSPSTVERIFDPFFTTKAVGAGTGQGLTFCNNIVVNSHGGKIEATSIPNEGSAFEIWLPLARRVDSDTAADMPILNLDPSTSPRPLIPA